MSKKLTLEEANNRLKKKHIKVCNYLGILKPVNATCLICGYNWITQANVLLNNDCGCPKCKKRTASKKISYTKETFLNICGDIGSIIMEGDYINSKTKTRFKCTLCDYSWNTTPDVFKRFKTCPNCSGNRKLTHDEFLERVKNAHGDAYEILSEYQGIAKKIKVKHISCGLIFETNASNFVGTGKKQPCGCPKCSLFIKSRGESKIEDFLISNNISFKRQFRFKDCKYIKTLPFDFAIFKNDSELSCLIEYDGMHHFKFNNEGIFTEEKFKSIIRNDEIKNAFCSKENIPLLRISYTDFNKINDILDNFLNKRSTTIESTQTSGSE